MSKTSIIFINQIREKVGGFSFGPSETTPGGRALRFYASIRLDVRRIGSVKQGDNIVGNEVKVKVTKNKLAVPFKLAFFEITYGKGISKVGEILDLALQYKFIIKSGSWFSYDKERLGQGRENVKQKLLENDELYQKIEKLVIDSINKEEGMKE